MKVLQINSVIDYGSTGRITRDLYDVLKKNGHECVIAFGRGDSTQGYQTIKIGSNFDQLRHGFYSRLTDRHGFASKKATLKFIEEVEDFNPDIIQLHNLHGYYLNIEVLFNYLSTKDIPVVWLLHDQWPVSGHSAYFDLNLNGKLPSELSNRTELANYPKTIGVSQFERNLEDKENLFTSIDNMTMITPSDWLTNFMKSSFLRKYPIKTIHNGVDTSIFKIYKKNVNRLREKWNAIDKIVVLGVASVWDERKGIDDFIEISMKLPLDKYQIILVGVDEKSKLKLPEEIISIKKTNSVDELRDIYNASDIFINPTYFDNFPTVNIESLACGTPVVTYDTGGSPESIDELTGSVVQPGNTNELIKEIIRIGKKNENIETNCCKRAMKNFDTKVVFNKYVDLYFNLADTQ